MRSKKYSCPNGCKLPPRKKELIQKNHRYTFGYNDFTYCPVCGGLMPETLKTIKLFFNVYHIHPKLFAAERLIYKSEFESAAREAFIVVENELRIKSGLDLHGTDLVIKALKFDYDPKTQEITKPPLIAINDLSSESKINEQEGVRFMLMGFFRGVRNIYQHNNVGSGVSNSIHVVLDASFYLSLLDGKSITNKGKWIKENVSYKDIYNNMPNFFDKLRFKYIFRIKERKTT